MWQLFLMTCERCVRKTSEAKLLITVYVTAAEALPNPAHMDAGTRKLFPCI